MDRTRHGTTNANKAYFLDDDINHFDAPLFDVQASEADAIDPQQRLLMEVVYNSLYDSPTCNNPTCNELNLTVAAGTVSAKESKTRKARALLIMLA